VKDQGKQIVKWHGGPMPMGMTVPFPRISATEQQRGMVAPCPWAWPYPFKNWPKHDFVLLLLSSSFKLLHFLSLQPRLLLSLSPHFWLKSYPKSFNLLAISPLPLIFSQSPPPPNFSTFHP